jgi:hypothetical protein
VVEPVTVSRRVGAPRTRPAILENLDDVEPVQTDEQITAVAVGGIRT